MLPSYIKDWLNVCINMQNENTYKLAFGKALVKCVCNNNFTYQNIDNKPKSIIDFSDVALYIFKYYWNQIDFFHLRQRQFYRGRESEEPKIINIVKEAILQYKRSNKLNTKKPVWFAYAIDNLHISKKHYVSEIKKILPQNVAWRFLKLKPKTINLYEYDKKKQPFQIFFDSWQIDLIKEYASIIDKFLTFKWALLLERYNDCPRILNKLNDVSSLSEPKIKRKSLDKYIPLLKQANDGCLIDFYTGKLISPDDVSVDHVIPWSYMYSDDVWNLVLTTKENNSKKSNSLVDSNFIRKLIERNKLLSDHLKDGKDKQLIDLSLQNNYVWKYYKDCKQLYE